MHEGHRMRMIERLEKSEETLQPHELLEMLLYNAVPRKNTNELAHELLDNFGSIQEILRADMRRLKAVKGVGNSVAAYLRLIGIFLGKVDFNSLPALPSAYSFATFSGYLIDRFRGASEEYLEFYAIDNNGTIKDRRRFTSGEAERVTLSPRKIAEFIADCNPSSMILVHNHLTNNFEPSLQDDFFTDKMYSLCTTFAINLRDHIIVSPAGIYSYYANGKMEEFRIKYAKSGGKA